MKMTQEQIAYVIGFLKGKNLLERCFVCGNKVEQQVNVELFEVKPGDPEEGLSLVIGQSRPIWYPVVYVCCPICGNVRLHNAVAIGLFPKLEENKDKLENIEPKPEEIKIIN